jgi:alkylation response protein AidB-like acyl-CoA dehydrogenase
MWGRFAELGVIGALATEAQGGFGGAGEDIMVVMEQAGRGLVVEPFAPTVLALSLLAETGADAALSEAALTGETQVAVAHGEPASRYDLSHVETRADADGDRFRLSGTKSVVLNGETADRLIVSARTDGAATDHAGVRLFLVDPKAPGVSCRPYGMIEGGRAADIALSGAEGVLLGEAWPALEVATGRATLAVCAEALGLMSVCQETTLDYLKTRKQFGRPIGAFQVIQHRMADMAMEVEQVRSAVILAAGKLDAPRREREMALSAAKNLVGRLGRKVAEEAIQLHGGIAMTWEYPLAHYAKRLVMIDHLFGDTDHHLDRFAALSMSA